MNYDLYIYHKPRVDSVVGWAAVLLLGTAPALCEEPRVVFDVIESVPGKDKPNVDPCFV